VTRKTNITETWYAPVGAPLAIRVEAWEVTTQQTDAGPVDHIERPVDSLVGSVRVIWYCEREQWWQSTNRKRAICGALHRLERKLELDNPIGMLVNNAPIDPEEASRYNARVLAHLLHTAGKQAVAGAVLEALKAPADPEA